MWLRAFVLASLAALWSQGIALANVTVEIAAARGMPVGEFVELPGPAFVETVRGEIGEGTIVLRAPAGFLFDTAADAITVTVTDRGICTGADGHPLRLAGPRRGPGQSVAVTASPSTVGVVVRQSSRGACAGTVTFSGIRVLATHQGSGWVTLDGTAAMAQVPFGSPVGALATPATSARDPGNAFAWGAGPLGNDATPPQGSAVPVAVVNLEPATAVAAGHDHSLALHADGTVWSWGKNCFGELGSAAVPVGCPWPEPGNSSSIPVKVDGLSSVAGIAASYGRSHAFGRDGSLWGWGRSGAIGDGTSDDRMMATRIQGVSGVVGLAAGHAHALAVLADGSLLSWGSSNGSGQLGNGSSESHFTPRPALVPPEMVAVAAGMSHSLALSRDGTVWTWGCYVNSCPTPRQVAGLNGIVAIAAYGQHSMALAGDGTVWTWGLNDRGQLGHPTGPEPYAQVVGEDGTGVLRGVVGIAAGFQHSLARMSDGTVRAWGSNSNGQLGYSGYGGSTSTPVTVSGLNGATSLAGGLLHSLATSGP